jgi:hypothetical protein
VLSDFTSSPPLSSRLGSCAPPDSWLVNCKGPCDKSHIVVSIQHKTPILWNLTSQPKRANLPSTGTRTKLWIGEALSSCDASSYGNGNTHNPWSVWNSIKEDWRQEELTWGELWDTEVDFWGSKDVGGWWCTFCPPEDPVLLLCTK